MSHGASMVAAMGLTPCGTTCAIYKTVESMWDLNVFCPCCDKDPNLVCYGACMTSPVRWMGLSMYVSPTCMLAYAHVNALLLLPLSAAPNKAAGISGRPGLAPSSATTACILSQVH